MSYRTAIVSLLSALAVLIAVPQAAWAIDADAWISGQKSGALRGEDPLASRRDGIQLLDFGWGMTSPRDAGSGLPTGRVQVHALRISKAVDGTSPILAGMVDGNENLSKVEIKFYRADRGGTTVNYMTYRLTNANIADLTVIGEKSGVLREVISLTFQKIELINPVTGATAVIDWASIQ
jgi:type VI secretion system secreted protein Hcp